MRGGCSFLARIRCDECTISHACQTSNVGRWSRLGRSFLSVKSQTWAGGTMHFCGLGLFIQTDWFWEEKHHSLLIFVLYFLQHGDPCRPCCNVSKLYEVAVGFATAAMSVSVISKVLQQ